MPFLELDPVRHIHYVVDDFTDPWTKPQSVVMIHGFTESTEAFRQWVPALAARYRVIRFDQHGFGRSSAVTPETVFTTEAFVEAAARVVTELGGGSAHVLGAKSGGLIAIELARLRPELVKTLTLASTPLDPPQPSKWLEHMETHGVASWARETMPPRLGTGMPREGFDWWVDLMGRTAIETARAYSRSDVEVYRERLPHAEIVALPGDGYHVSATNPDECARTTLDFLARHGG
jgi:pimeloyl-ACP methyl ester carboxylesterase